MYPLTLTCKYVIQSLLVATPLIKGLFLTHSSDDHSCENTAAADPGWSAQHITGQQQPGEGSPYRFERVDQGGLCSANELLHPVHHQQREGNIDRSHQQNRKPE